jgi:ectoine hydroxylase-related dioxygenase (phytanoyl-CoA dioxygenase family)
LVFWDSRIWHGARENVTGGTRWSIIATFCRWWIKQAFDIPGNLPQEIYDQLSDRQRAVLGFCSVPYDDESRGIDMKRSYALLPANVADYRL